MDLNDLRIVVTLLSFVAFVGIVGWAWSRRNRQRFDEAAQLPFVDGETTPAERHNERHERQDGGRTHE